MALMNGGEAVVAALEAAGVDHVFGLLGSSTMEMYDALYSLPPHDAGLIETAATEVLFELTPGKTYYVTVMAFDEYHERIGKTLYLQSNELRIDPGMWAAESGG